MVKRAAIGRPFPCRTRHGSRRSFQALNSCAPLPNTRVMSIESTLTRVSTIKQALADPAALLSQKTALNGGTEAPSGLPTGATSAGSGESSFAAALAQAGEGYSPAASTGQLGAAGAYGVGLPGITGLTGTSGATGLTGAAGTSLTGVSSLGYPSELQGITGASLPSPGSGPGGRIVAIAETQIGQAEQPPGSNESPAIAQYRDATAGAVPGAPWCAYFASWAAQQAGEPLGLQGQGLGSVSDIWSWAQSSGRAIPNGPGVVPQPGDLIVFGDSHVGIVKEVLPSGQIATIEGNYENKVAANVRSPGEATGYVSL